MVEAALLDKRLVYYFICDGLGLEHLERLRGPTDVRVVGARLYFYYPLCSVPLNALAQFPTQAAFAAEALKRKGRFAKRAAEPELHLSEFVGDGELAGNCVVPEFASLVTQCLSLETRLRLAPCASRSAP